MQKEKENDFDYLGRQLCVSCFGFYGGYLKSGSVRSLGRFSSSLGSLMKLIQFGNFGWGSVGIRNSLEVLLQD